MSLLSLAAANNAHWCDTVCGLHSVPGQFKTDLWVNINKVPTYYPNIITLSENVDLKTIMKLVKNRHHPCSIKDSFNKLDLSNLGFSKLFEAQWLQAPAYTQTNIKWSIVTSNDELGKWLSAWDAEHSDIFKSKLLSNADIKFIGVYKDAKIVAGAIVSKASGVVGITNFFCNTSDPLPYRQAIAVAANSLFPDIDIVGYEHGKELEISKQAGFKPLGPLSVWAKA